MLRAVRVDGVPLIVISLFSCEQDKALAKEQARFWASRLGLGRDAEISSTTWSLLPAVLLWFVLGFALYSFAYAAAGAIVARQEEVQFVVMPMTLLIAAS